MCDTLTGVFIYSINTTSLYHNGSITITCVLIHPIYTYSVICTWVGLTFINVCNKQLVQIIDLHLVQTHIELLLKKVIWRQQESWYNDNVKQHVSHISSGHFVAGLQATKVEEITISLEMNFDSCLSFRKHCREHLDEERTHDWIVLEQVHSLA